MNSAFKMMNSALTMMNSAFKMMNSALQMMDSALKMMNSAFENDTGTSLWTHLARYVTVRGSQLILHYIDELMSLKSDKTY